MALVAVACGNSNSSKPASVTTPTVPGGSGSSVTEATGADLQKDIPLPGVVGVTDKEIRVAVITAGSNPLAGNYAKLADGIQAYFNYINSQGGIYGRQLKIVANRDDGFGNDEQTVKQSLATDNAFATFVATVFFTGVPDLVTANQPTFIWNINSEFAGHPNIFANLGALCNGCNGQGAPFLAQYEHFTRVGVIAYNQASSKACAEGLRRSFLKYPSAQVVYLDENLGLAQPDLSSQVAQMKQKGVQLIFTCIDQNETLILGKELVKQNLNAVQSLPNAYDATFVRDNAQYLEGDFVAPQFVALEYQPQIPIVKLFVQWMAQSGKSMSELAGYGWIDAVQLVTGLKLAGPNFSQQKVIDALNRDTHFDAEGMIQPIDWTRQHNNPIGQNGNSIPAYAGKWDCASTVRVHNGRLVPLFSVPNKQWVCFVGGPNAPKLTTTPIYENFAASTG
ncbi:MAG TPA: ABC transporter substrate-binding protein [Acidimicrobiia bacterium]|nr:ABC transporter substrate-binding protein [Acidimicrobiia bacterium]